MNIKIETAKPEDWELIQKLNNQVFVNDKDNDEDLNLEWPFSETGIKYYKKLFTWPQNQRIQIVV